MIRPAEIVLVLDSAALNLWDHQRAAVNECDRYFAEGPAQQSALVHFPTGAGKTGIMAVLARRRAETAPAIVVCPSAALVLQLEREFRTDFWAKIGAPDDWRFSFTARL